MKATNVDFGKVIMGNNTADDELIAIASATTLLAGTLLARKTVSDTIALGAVTGTGARAMVASALPGRTPKIGVYTLTAGTLVAQVGPWTLTDPDGIAEKFTSVAADDVLKFPELGIQISVASTGTAYVTGDARSVTVAVQTGTPLVPFSKTGTGGAQNLCAVLDEPITTTAQANVVARPIKSGRVNASRLVIHEDGNGNNITPSMKDQLRACSIIPITVEQLAAFDNQ